MADDNRKDRGLNARSLIYVLIPLGFVLIVGFLILGGEAVQEAPEEGVVDEIVEGAEDDVGE